MHLRRVVRYRTLAEEVGAANGTTPSGSGSGSNSHPGGAALKEALAAEDSAANASLYLLLRAADRFHALSGCCLRPSIASIRLAQILSSIFLPHTMEHAVTWHPPSMHVISGTRLR